MSPSDDKAGYLVLSLPPDVPSGLLSWYDRTRRDLPWRRTKDPWLIWVSEIMLQQTTVPTVLRYFDRFVARFPTVESLGKASLPEVLSLWEGLGYYQRARNLHRAAGSIPLSSGGPVWPGTVAGWMALPGIGRSTAGAILSISTDRWAPILDANVRRVIERFFGVREDLSGREALLWEGSDLWGAGSPRPGDTNQALMELGARVCLPGTPDCRECPVRIFCRAKGPMEKRSDRPKKPKNPVRHRVALIPDSGPLLLAPRNEGRFLEGLHDICGFSSPELSSGSLIPEGPFRGCRVVRTLFSVRQVYSHVTEVVHATLVVSTEGFRVSEGEEDAIRRVPLGDFQGAGSPGGPVALTGVARKIVRRLLADRPDFRDPGCSD